MKHPSRLIAIGLLAFSLQASAQRGLQMPDPIARLTPAQKQALSDQADGFFTAAKPAVATAAKSTVSVLYRGRRLSFGTAISEDGKILTKWSEVAPASQGLVVRTPNGTNHAAIVTGVYKEHDLAILKCDAQLTPIDWFGAAPPELGEFIALANPAGEVEGLGVVSVKSRSLRERDKAYLGVMMDFTAVGKGGIPLKQVMADSAASKAGLKNGDVVLAIDDNKIQGAMEMRNILQRLVPGSEIQVRYRRGEEEHDTKVLLGSRADSEDIRRVPQARMSKMQRMGAVPSKVRENFPNVLQSDMAIEPDDTGAPVVDLEGKVVGVTIARGSRIKTYIIPTTTILEILATKPIPYTPDLAAQIDADSRNRAQAQVNPRTREGNRNTSEEDESPVDKVRRHIDEIGRNQKATQDSLREIEDALRRLDRENRRNR
ncbi:hypothetical protein NT6N_19330 [Oceaniferula spumae]|uniref:PDZ domain-containing protein n=1 Tax=Oceaniferula spumae TaxID=2979115 RepID=A0AAT9FLR2_9BACT